jgi:hypothetical protein
LSNDDWEPGFKIGGSIILVFFVVGKIAFLDAKLSDSIPAIGSVVFSLYFFNTLISLGKLNTFLHVLEVVAPSIIGKGVLIGRKVLSGTRRVIVHEIIGVKCV